MMPSPSLADVRRVYGSIESAALGAAQAQGYPCASGCAWCCHSPVVVNHRDLELLKAAVAGLPQEDRMTALANAAAYMERVKAAGLDLTTPGGYDRIAKVNAYALLPALAKFWPDGGIPCPLLRPEVRAQDGALPEPVPGRGSCMIYPDRPAQCRVYFAAGPEACRPPRSGRVAELDTSRAMQKLVNTLHLRSAGILAVELWRAFRVMTVS